MDRTGRQSVSIRCTATVRIQWMKLRNGWTATPLCLGYTTAYCFSLANGYILYDARGWLSSVQARLREPFPEQLTRSIIAKNRPVLGGGMQSCYLVQMKAAIARNDLISLNHRTTVWIASYADILFAVNRRYHPGEKRLLTYMADLPSRAGRRLGGPNEAV